MYQVGEGGKRAVIEHLHMANHIKFEDNFMSKPTI